jgi:hypothetical protein
VAERPCRFNSCLPHHDSTGLSTQFRDTSDERPGRGVNCGVRFFLKLFDCIPFMRHSHVRVSNPLALMLDFSDCCQRLQRRLGNQSFPHVVNNHLQALARKLVTAKGLFTVATLCKPAQVAYHGQRRQKRAEVHRHSMGMARTS